MSCYILIIVCIILTILTVSPKEGCAANIYKYNFSKYYKKYSSKSPEYVVINFIELADLGKDASREDSERLPLYWALTESGTVSDSSQCLLIKSYNIAGKSNVSPKEAIVKLKLEVSAIRLIGCTPKNSNPVQNYRNKQLNYCDWRANVVSIFDDNTKIFSRFNLSDSIAFINYAFDNGQVAVEILEKKPNVYIVPKNKRIWVFEIRVVKKGGNWLISKDSIPVEMSYVDNEIEIYREMLKTFEKRKDICDGNLNNDNTFDLEENKNERCRINLDRLRHTKHILKVLETAEDN
jgi:hypothetical protein